MWISKQKWESLEKRVADLEREVQDQHIKNEISFEFCQSVANQKNFSLFPYQHLYGPYRIRWKDKKGKGFH